MKFFHNEFVQAVLENGDIVEGILKINTFGEKETYVIPKHQYFHYYPISRQPKIVSLYKLEKEE